MRMVIAIGGHALAPQGAPRADRESLSGVADAARVLAPLIREHEVVITHGIGSERTFGTRLATALRRAVPGLVTASLKPSLLGDVATLVEAGLMVIAPTGSDLAAVALATAVEADALMLLTEVDAVYRDFGTPNATPLRRLTTAQAEAFLAGGTVSPPSMAPKLEAALRFASTGGFAVIAALDDAQAALHRAAGTRVVLAEEPVRLRSGTPSPKQGSCAAGSYRFGGSPPAGTDAGSSSPMSRRNGGYSSRMSPA